MANPPHKPTDDQRKSVKAMSAYGIPQDDISKAVGITAKTLRKAYRDELDLGHICLARWRKDGFMSLEAPTQGSWTTVPMSFAGAQLRVNAYTPYGGEILVELAREDGEPIPGFTFEDCDSISGDVPDHVVTWQGRSDVSALAGESLRMRWRMRRAHLHSLQFTH